MTQEEKDLLLRKDLYSRLLYKPKVHVEHDIFYDEREPYDTELDLSVLYNRCAGMEIKPYLRPISTMTSNELDELIKRLNHTSAGRIINKENFQIMPVLNVVWFTNMKEYECVSTRMMNTVIDFLNEYHFDYNDLISMDLAIEAPIGMYKID